MSRLARMTLLGAVVVLLQAPVAWAQHPSELVGFNGPPIDDPATSQEMFKLPEWSGSTVDYIVPNSEGAYDWNSAFRASGLQTEGAAALQVLYNWVDTNDPDAWVRLTTFNAPERPNPSLHVEGQVRFKITNRSELFDGEIGICLGIRETGIEVPQLADGGSSGTIEWVGVSTTPNGIIAGPDGIVDTAATGDDVQEYPVGYDIINDPNEPLPTGTAIISPGPNGDIDTTPVTDDELRFGYFIAANGNRRPIPAITLPPAPSPYVVEWDLSTGVVTLDGTPMGGGIAGFTGDGNLNGSPPRGTLEHIAITNLASDVANQIEVAIDELQFESPDPDPVHPPTVVWPIIAGAETVTVTDLQYGVNQVNLLLGGGPLLSEDVTTTDDVIFTLPALAQTGQVYTATQRVGAITSEESLPVTVLPEPPPYTFCLLVDETGTGSCTPYEPGLEWVGVTDASGFAPQGSPVFTDGSLWQIIDIPLDNDDLILPSPFGGDGTLGDSPTGYYTIDSLWFTLAEEGQLGPWEVFIDAVQVIDEFGQPGEVILDMEDGVNRLQHARGQSPDELGLISSQLSTISSYDGTTSHRLEWEYDGVPLESIGMLQRIGWSCGTSALIPDTSTAVRFHMVLRGQPTAPDIPLPQVAGPIIVGDQYTVRVVNDPNAVSVQLFLNGDAWGDPGTPTDTYTDFSGLVLEPGHSLSASQTLPAGTSDPAYPRTVVDTTPPPTVSVPIAPGSTSVEVVDVLAVPHATALLVEVYVNANPDPSGSAVPGGETVVVSLDVTLVTGDQVTATQTVNGETSAESEAATVAFPVPVIFAAPAEDDPNVLVMNLNPSADALTVVVNGTTEFTATPDPGADRCNVPVSGLAMGDLVTAYYTVGEVNSVESDYEVVTTNAITTIFCDDFEYEQADYEAAWPEETGHPRLELVDTKNATEDGQKSLYAPDGNSRVDKIIAPLIPTETDPVVVNFDIYDEVGVGNTAAQFIQLNGDLDVGDWFLMEAGILGWENTDNVHYDLRAIGNGGPNWVDLDEFDAPDRSVGWHNITIVHKGNRIDAYVDGLLAMKNLPLTDETTYEFAAIGAAPYSSGTAYFDDYCVEVGPVRFGWVPEEQGCPNPGGSGNYCTADIEGGNCIVELGDLARLLTNYGVTSGAEHDDGDLDGDGDVDLTDLAGLLGQYGDDCN